MSKAVKSIGRAIKKVVKGVVKAVKKVAQSKIGRVILAAATVYFGGAAIMGAMGGASAGSGFLGTISGAAQGAAAGISSAWSGLTGAAGALAGGQGLGAAASSIGSGFTGAYGAGQAALGGAAAGSSLGGGLSMSPTGAPQIGGGGLGSGLTAGGGSTGLNIPGSGVGELIGKSAADKGIISSAWNSLGDYGKHAAVQGATQLIGGAVQGMGQQKALEEQRRYEQEQAQAARDRYNANVGVNWWSSSEGDSSAVNSQQQTPGLIGGYIAPSQRKYEEEMRRQRETYNPYALA